MAKLSIVMPIYNVAPLLARSLNSLEQQVNQNFELIMVDDCSTDDTREVAKKYSEKNKNFKLISLPKNQGISSARNIGLEQVDTEYVTFMDGDDWVEPDYVDYFLDSFFEHNVELVICGYHKESAKGIKKVADNKNIQGITDSDEIIKYITKTTGPIMGYTWNKAYCVDLIKSNNLSFDGDINLMEDQVFNVKYATLSTKIYVNTTPLYHYWQRDDSVTHSIDVDNIKSVGIANYRIVKTIMESKRKAID